MLTSDEGYYFGMGAFETVAVEEGKAILLKEHYHRLYEAVEFLGFSLDASALEEKVQRALEAEHMRAGRKVLKITVSEKNILVSTRENTYSDAAYRKGFATDYSEVRRNETSPFTYHKTLNYGDCLREKRLAAGRGIQEPVFLNTGGMIAEGACTNVFFVRKGRLYTPSVSCGLLPGILRSWICRRYDVTETEIYPADVSGFDEMFVTNSLLGVMPVTALFDHRFSGQDMGRRLLDGYRRFCREE